MTFFGLETDYRMLLFAEIDALVVQTQGAYDWETIYNMPIWLRRFTMNKAIQRIKNKQKTPDPVEQTIRSIKQAEQAGIVRNKQPDYFVKFNRNNK